MEAEARIVRLVQPEPWLPRAPLVIARIVEAFRLRPEVERLTKGTATPAQWDAYLRGKRVRPSTSVFIGAVLDALCPGPFGLPGVDPKNIKKQWIAAFARLSKLYDALVEDLTALGVTPTNPVAQCFPVLLMFTKRTAFQWAAYQTLQEFAKQRPIDMPWFLEEAALFDVMKEEAKRAKVPIADLANPSVRSNWRQGHGLPSVALIQRMAERLGDTDGRIARRLRLATGGLALRRWMDRTLGPAVTDSLALTFRQTATAVRRALTKRGGTPLEKLDPRYFDGEVPAMALHGPDMGGLGACLGNYFAEWSRQGNGDPENAADFVALPGNWRDRVRHWTVWGNENGERVRALPPYMREAKQGRGKKPGGGRATTRTPRRKLV